MPRVFSKNYPAGRNRDDRFVESIKSRYSPSRAVDIRHGTVRRLSAHKSITTARRELAHHLCLSRKHAAPHIYAAWIETNNARTVLYIVMPEFIPFTEFLSTTFGRLELQRKSFDALLSRLCHRVASCDIIQTDCNPGNFVVTMNKDGAIDSIYMIDFDPTYTIGIGALTRTHAARLMFALFRLFLSRFVSGMSYPERADRFVRKMMKEHDKLADRVRELSVLDSRSVVRRQR